MRELWQEQEDQEIKLTPNEAMEVGGDQHVLHVTPIIDSINYVYGQDGTYIHIFQALSITLEIAIEQASAAAVHPEDSPQGWREAMA